ncbi:MAG: hypothetical protein AAB362_01110 [Patescibacteria group bacterium]
MDGLAYWILRAGVGYIYLYSGWGLFFHSAQWYFYVPGWFSRMLADIGIAVDSYLKFQGAIEFVIGMLFFAWFLKSKWVGILGLFMAFEMALILVLYGSDQISFRDVAIMSSGLAIFMMTANFQNERQNEITARWLKIFSVLYCVGLVGVSIAGLMNGKNIFGDEYVGLNLMYIPAITLIIISFSKEIKKLWNNNQTAQIA